MGLIRDPRASLRRSRIAMTSGFSERPDGLRGASAAGFSRESCGQLRRFASLPANREPPTSRAAAGCIGSDTPECAASTAEHRELPGLRKAAPAADSRGLVEVRELSTEAADIPQASRARTPARAHARADFKKSVVRPKPPTHPKKRG